MPTREQIQDVLREVIDPELRKDIVTLGMVRSIEQPEEGRADVIVSLTTSGCPIRAHFEKAVIEKVSSLGISQVNVGFDVLSDQEKGAGGEIQLTDAIAALLQEAPVDAYRFQGTRFDCGTHIGLIEATIRYALDHETLSEAAARTMQNALDELGVVELK
jgi:metal-sulfur cluster biosynthetic enzyme